MSIERKSFGTLWTGEETELVVLKAGEFTASFSSYGATWLSFLMPRGKGLWDDVLLGLPTLSGLAGPQPFFGSTVGRFANRIARARFALDGKEHTLPVNNGPNHLHGGPRGFARKVWGCEAFEEDGEPTAVFSLTSPDGDSGYPGRLSATARYSLSRSGSLSVSFSAETDVPTVVNLTNHAYFNLKGEGEGDILGHELELRASRYLPVDETLIPTGIMAPVEGTPFDFRRPLPLGSRIAEAGGYDHCYVLDRPEGGGLFEFAAVREPGTGRRMRVSTTLPGVQLYTGNFLSQARGKGASIYDKHGGFCLETQFFPDSPNRPDFPSAVLRPGEAWRHETVYSFEP